jgi:hypothetical protein
MMIKQVRILGLDNKLRTRIKQFGDVWNVERGPVDMPCFKGKGVAIMSLDGEHQRNIPLDVIAEWL